MGPEPVFPTTVSGWLSLIITLSICVGWFYTRGKSARRFEDVEKKVADLRPLEVDHARIMFTLWGPNGDDGLHHQVQQVERRVNRLEKFHTTPPKNGDEE